MVLQVLHQRLDGLEVLGQASPSVKAKLIIGLKKATPRQETSKKTILKSSFQCRSSQLVGNGRKLLTDQETESEIEL